ncbi:MAG: alanine racemase [Patescibacteria group bacterium]|jgi:alanine racemase
MKTPPGKTWLEISTSALAHNARELKRLIGREVRLIAVVKSNAYGHGLALVARAVKNAVDVFAVDQLSEAQTIRAADVRRPVIILGYTPNFSLAETIKSGFSFTVYNPETIRAAGRLATKKHPARIHLKIETGTSRQGVLAADLPAILKLVRRQPHVILEGVSTHYANIEDTTDPTYARLQLKRFHSALAAIADAGLKPKFIHTACSAAAILYPESRFNAVRVGIALYGLWPSPETKASTKASTKAFGRRLDLRPALAWKTVVAQVKKMPAGAPVSYGLTERLKQDAQLAVLPVGYWDGFGRGLSSVGEVLIRGRRCRVVGRVCMNMCVVDASAVPDLRPGEIATLIGSQGRDRVSAEELAARLSTINYEAVTRINPLTPRIPSK